MSRSVHREKIRDRSALLSHFCCVFVMVLFLRCVFVVNPLRGHCSSVGEWVSPTQAP